MILYKLTTQDGWTRKGENNACLWGAGVTHSGTGKGDLCGPGFIHAYTSPELAVLFNPIHANIRDPKLWESEGEVAKTDRGAKVGCVSLTTLRELPLPVATDEIRRRFAMLCVEAALAAVAGEVAGDEPWQRTYREKVAEWRDAMARGDDGAAADAANAAAYAAANAAANAAARAACAVPIELDVLAKQAFGETE